MDEIKMQALLKEVYYINNKYEETAKISGENFNVFDILGRSRHENSHSAFIAELLNSNGSHGCKDAFLKLFLNQLLIAGEMPNFADGEISVFTEYFIGFKDNEIDKVAEDEELEEYSGRIDILLKNKRNQQLIIIENKIDAKDQIKQIKRYYDFAREKESLFKIFYLTKENKEPNIKSSFGLKSNFYSEENPDYFCISYKEHMIKWLESCLNEANNYPFVRESISQYINLIKKLTNQSITHKMSKDIIGKIIASEESFVATNSLTMEFENAKKQLLDDFWKDVKKALDEKVTPLIVSFNYKKQNENMLSTRCPTMFIETNNKEVLIGIEPLNGKHWNSDFNELFVGIFNNNKKIEKNLPFPEWSELERTKYNFAEIETLKKIIPNTPSRVQIINEIIEIVSRKIKSI